MISSQRSGPSISNLFARTRTGIDGPALAGAAIRILIVDDIEAWHSIYIEVLRRQSDWQVVGVAQNGMEAVQKCWELKPDLVLLDVGLGRTDRLQLARQIREVSPKSSILLVGTADPSQLAEIAQSIDADGYVIKRDLVLDLVPAVETVAKERRSRGRSSS